MSAFGSPSSSVVAATLEESGSPRNSSKRSAAHITWWSGVLVFGDEDGFGLRVRMCARKREHVHLWVCLRVHACNR